ncbi:MAG: DUF488 family protein [Actinomycetota bacterium]|nr:DUF488 family protein [Actinomycetota bacterium]
MRIQTIGHGRRSLEELVACLEEVGAPTLVDVRRFPGSRRNPQFNQQPLHEALGAADLDRMHPGFELRDGRLYLCIGSSRDRRHPTLKSA